MQPQDVYSENLPSIRSIYQLHDTKAKGVRSHVKLPSILVFTVYGFFGDSLTVYNLNSSIWVIKNLVVFKSICFRQVLEDGWLNNGSQRVIFSSGQAILQTLFVHFLILKELVCYRWLQKCILKNNNLNSTNNIMLEILCIWLDIRMFSNPLDSQNLFELFTFLA